MNVRTGQVKLKKMAYKMSRDEPLNDQDKAFLVKALIKISDGEDAETVLSVKAKKGERKGKYTRKTKFNNELAYGWLATAIAQEEDNGLGLTLKDAVAKLKTDWTQLPSENTLRRYWNNVKDSQERDFKIKTD